MDSSYNRTYVTAKLWRGFLLNELYREMDEHILDQFTLKGIYEN